MAEINEKETLELERQRVLLREILRSKGMTISTDATTGEMIPLVGNLPVKNAEETFSNGTMSAYIDTTNTAIRRSFFRDMTSLQSAEITKATYIGDECFNGCSNLVSVRLDKITAFSNAMFWGCSSLQYVYAPRSTVWGTNSFRDLMSIKHFITPSFTPDFNISGGNNSILEKLDVYSSRITNTYPQLTLLIVRRIDGYVALPNANNIHQGNPDGVQIYVPQSLVDSYKSANNWSVFADCINALEDSIYEDVDWYEDYLHG